MHDFWTECFVEIGCLFKIRDVFCSDLVFCRAWQSVSHLGLWLHQQHASATPSIRVRQTWLQWENGAMVLGWQARLLEHLRQHFFRLEGQIHPEWPSFFLSSLDCCWMLEEIVAHTPCQSKSQNASWPRSTRMDLSESPITTFGVIRHSAEILQSLGLWSISNPSPAHTKACFRSHFGGKPRGKAEWNFTLIISQSRPCKHSPEARLQDHVAGHCCACEISSDSV